MTRRRAPRSAVWLTLSASIALGAVGLATVGAGVACAADEAKDPAAAEALFKQARSLWDAGKKDDACAKFAASYALDPAPGTLLNLAACTERDGKTATAWSQFVEAARVFRRRNDERRAAFADAQANALLPKLAYVVVHADAPPQGLVLTRDGASFQTATLDAKLPVDPGAHEIVAQAPGHAEARVTFEATGGATVRVVVPTLEEAPEPPADGGGARPGAGALDEVSGRGDGQRIAAFVVGGAGVASLVVGGVFVGLTANAKSSLGDQCPGSVCSTPEARSSLSDANMFANVANGTLIGGAVLLGVGVVVFLTAPSDEPPDLSRIELAPRAVCGPAGCGVGWAF